MTHIPSKKITMGTKKGHLELESNDDTVLMTHFNLNNKNMYWTKYNIRQKDNASV